MKYGGAERCLDGMLEAFPGAQLFASVIDRSRVPSRYHHAVPSYLQRLPGATRHHEYLLPLMPSAWHLRRKIGDVDAVISSSYACAKAVRVAVGIPHVCYCHTPMRYAWAFDEERERFPAPLRGLTRLAMSSFRRWDRATASGVTLFLANSSAVAARVEHAYCRRARVVHPPVDTGFFHPAPRQRAGFVYVARLTGYKRPDVVIRAFAELPYPLTVVGDGPLRSRMQAIATPNVRFLQSLSREDLRELYRTSTAMVFPVNEDFGIAMAEAQACGTPVIGLAAGGALDIVEPGRTGWLVEQPDVAEIRAAVRKAASDGLDPAYIADRARRFSAGRFRRELRKILVALAHGTADESDFV